MGNKSKFGAFIYLHAKNACYFKGHGLLANKYYLKILSLVGAPKCHETTSIDASQLKK